MIPRPAPVRPLRAAAAITAVTAVAANLAFASVLAAAAPPTATATPTAPAPAPDTAPDGDDQHIQFTGIVSDLEGRPVPGVQVALEMARSYLSLRQLRRAEKDARRIATATNDRGEYAIDWPYDDSYDRFRLLAGVTVRHGKTESFEVLEREEVTERVLAGSPVVSAIVIHNRAIVDRLRDFVASVQSADEHRAYDEMGVPDDVKRVNYSGRPQDTEVSWWYFEAGKVYRFRDGRLEQVERFDPVRRF